MIKRDERLEHRNLVFSYHIIVTCHFPSDTQQSFKFHASAQHHTVLHGPCSMYFEVIHFVSLAQNWFWINQKAVEIILDNHFSLHLFRFYDYFCCYPTETVDRSSSPSTQNKWKINADKPRSPYLNCCSNDIANIVLVTNITATTLTGYLKIWRPRFGIFSATDPKIPQMHAWASKQNSAINIL